MKKSSIKKICLFLFFMVFLPFLAFGETDIDYSEEGLKIKSGKNWIKLGGSMMLDFDTASSEFWNKKKNDEEDEEKNDEDWQTRAELRRIRIFIKAKFSDNWKSKLQIDFGGDDNSVEVKDAYVEYDGFDPVNITLGQHKEPFGMEAMTSSKNLSFIERSAVSSAFGPGRNIGLSLGWIRKRLFCRIGAFETSGSDEEKANIFQVAGRFGVEPWKTDTVFFHIGASGAYQDYGEKEFEIKESPEIHTADNLLFSIEIDADTIYLYGLESAFGWGPFSFAAEYIKADVKAVLEEDSTAFDGYYISAGWILTGEKKPFENGGWERVIPESSYGAWELAARYSHLDAADKDYGTDSTIYTGGLNWYINSHIQLMADYEHLELENEETKKDIRGDGVSLRFQCVF